jgi:hypothetical protein
MCKAFTYIEKCYSCGWESPELEKSEARPGHELCSDAMNRKNPWRYGYMSCRRFPKPRPSLEEECVTIYEPHNGTQCMGRCAEQEEDDIAVFGAEIARQHKSEWKQALLEVQKEHAEKRRQVQQQHIDDCVETMREAPKKAAEAHKKQEKQVDQARQHLARIKTWQQMSDQGTIWREDMYQTMGAQESFS